MVSFIVEHRRFFIVTIQLALVALANACAFGLRFDGNVPAAYVEIWKQTILLLLFVRGIIFAAFRFYEGFWRYTGISDLCNLLTGVFLSSVLFVGILEGLWSSVNYPRSVFVIDAILSVCFLAGVRLIPRIYRELAKREQGSRVLIYGAGDAGEVVVRDMRRHGLEYEPIGFIDDSPKKQGVRIHGVPVLGTRAQLADIMRTYQPDEIVVAIPKARPQTIRQIVQTLAPFKVPIKTLPSLQDLLNGTVTVQQIRDLAIEDLLERPPVQLNLAPVLDFVRGKRVLVTGAGGSIGAELCRQLARYNPRMLILLDKAESALYDIDLEVGQRLSDDRKVAFLADVKNTTRLHDVFEHYAPQIVFHAAAYKHVPMMEAHPEEGVLNNIVGTRSLCELAVRFGVETFVQISTDKAVNPTNVMGATKRVTELYLQALAHSASHGRTVFCAVRFGNVLGSNGSVVPVFLRQIKSGGPVTVTHPEITRYFMSIPEAVQLVLQAAPLAKGGEIFVLDMGEQIKVLDMARHLIRLSGFVPDEDIKIVFTGLRPGEKLFEELVGQGETESACQIEKIHRVCSASVPALTLFAAEIESLDQLARRGQADAIRKALQRMLPNFQQEKDSLAPSPSLAGQILPAPQPNGSALLAT